MAKLLKELYDENYINILSDNIIANYSSFNKKKFITSIFNDNWQNKELKQRMRHISNTLCMIFQDFVEVYGYIYKKIL